MFKSKSEEEVPLSDLEIVKGVLDDRLEDSSSVEIYDLALGFGIEVVLVLLCHAISQCKSGRRPRRFDSPCTS